MHRFMNKVLCNILFLVSASVFASPIEINLAPHQSTILTNTNNQKIFMLCEVHAVSSAKSQISIQIIHGKGTFNGTTFKQGDFLVSTLSNLQQIPVLAEAGTQAQVNNLGAYPIRAICNSNN
ncbi:hypothetical protein DGG96_04995 [Legionella qingyii]|uniref:Uncharacterized protein n=1 Tax=Legionella qingyii TaxID=2184757 RepID=A0A317U6E6_9GAMM|nr:hypothetical protein [Legionella qingyii]PWY56768.1 hypothetical protein DGG96_04995 [Legionella qingyii]RUR23677.1 hypothetical protein ELY20_06620 [Legionella qingyii]RUR26260.1 hypothetical protein ELY16_07480 [Legionella qingyii]